MTDYRRRPRGVARQVALNHGEAELDTAREAAMRAIRRFDELGEEVIAHQVRLAITCLDDARDTFERHFGDNEIIGIRDD
jgi:hypothetical protein